MPSHFGYQWLHITYVDSIALSKIACDKHTNGMFSVTGLIQGLQPANERRRYKVTPSLIGWAQT